MKRRTGRQGKPRLVAGTAISNAWFNINISGHITTNGTYAIALDEQGNTYNDLDSSAGGFTPYLEVISE